MQVVVKKPNEPAEIRQIDENKLLVELQGLVGGFIEEMPITPTVSVICHEEGLSVENPQDNCGFVGTIVLVHSTPNGWSSLLDGEALKALKWCEKNKDVPHPDKSGGFGFAMGSEAIQKFRDEREAAMVRAHEEWEEL